MQFMEKLRMPGMPKVSPDDGQHKVELSISRREQKWRVEAHMDGKFLCVRCGETLVGAVEILAQVMSQIERADKERLIDWVVVVKEGLRGGHHDQTAA